MLVSNPPQTCVLLATVSRPASGGRGEAAGPRAACFGGSPGTWAAITSSVKLQPRGTEGDGVGAWATWPGRQYPQPTCLSFVRGPLAPSGTRNAAAASHSSPYSLTAATAGRGASPPVTMPPPLPIQASPGPHLPFPPPPAPAWFPSALPTLPSWTKVTSAAYLPIWPSSSVRLGRKPQEGRACGTSTAHLA